MALSISAFILVAYFAPLVINPKAKASAVVWIMPTLPPLSVGDWVLRAGTAPESAFIQSISQGDYSHIGMLVGLEPEPLIVHATTDDDPTRLNQVLISPLHDFISPALAQHFAIVRPHFITPQQQQAAADWLLEQVSRPFVLSARDNPHLYCTTLLADALQAANVSFTPQWQHIKAPLLSGEYLFPNAFAEYEGIEWVYRTSNKNRTALITKNKVNTK